MANFTPQEIEQFLQEFFDTVGARQYIGARYVPIFGRAGSDTVEWDDLAPYEPLTVVMHDGVSYVSRRYVPAGIEITNTDYWVETYRFNAQVEQYRQEVMGYSARINEAFAAVGELRDDVARDYVPFPDEDHYPKYGTAGQVLSTLADGSTRWEDPIVPSDEQAETVITSWLDEHPEATTTVVDGAVTTAKIADGAVTDVKLAPTGIKSTVETLEADVAVREYLYGEYVDQTVTALDGICNLRASESNINVYTGTALKHCVIIFDTVPELLSISGNSASTAIGSEYYMAAFYDASGNRLARYGTNSSQSYDEMVVQPPADAAKLYVNFDPATHPAPVGYFSLRNLRADIEQINEDLGTKEDRYKTFHKIDGLMKETKICYFSPQESDMTLYDMGRHIKVTLESSWERLRVTCRSAGTTSGARYNGGAFYSGTGQLISMFGNDPNTKYTDLVVDIPDGAATCYVNINDQYPDLYPFPEAYYDGDLDETLATVLSYTPDPTTVLCYGDSLTMGAGGGGTTYPNVLASILGSGYDVRNYGVGGETAQQIAGRQGGVPIIIEPTTITTSAYSIIELSSNFDHANIGRLGYQSSAGLNPVTVNDKLITLYFDNSGNQTAKAINSNVAIQRPTMIFPFSSTFRNKTLLLWMGANGWPTADVDDLVDMCRQCIEYNGNDNYIVVGITSRTGYVREDFEAAEAKMMRAFGYHFANLREYLVEYGLEDAGITPTTQDEADIAAGLVPSSLKNDGVHFTATGYTVIANYLHARGHQLGLW